MTKPGRMSLYVPLTVLVFCATLLRALPANGASREAPQTPWARTERANYPPGRPGIDYTPVVVPNGATLAHRIRKGVKVYHLVSRPIRHEIAEGFVVDTWGYNGRTPGPVIEAVEGDRVRIYVTNLLPAPHSVHWHAVLVPCGMDGVAGLTQAPISPGETFRYEFVFPEPGTFMYHSHHDSMTQDGLGLVGMIVVHPRHPVKRKPDRDFALMLHEWDVKVGTRRPNTITMTDFNVLTINGRAFPGTESLVAKLGDRVRIRFGNLSAMDHHPIHLHGYAFKVVETDGGAIPESAQWPETTVLVPVGTTRSIEFIADNPGDWLMHCHMTHHMMNQMGHDIPNMVGVDPGELDERIRRILPGYMTMGQDGMGHGAQMGMPIPPNSIPMVGRGGQFGYITMGGMVSILKVREKLENGKDPGWYRFPQGSVSSMATPEELRADGIE